MNIVAATSEHADALAHVQHLLSEEMLYIPFPQGTLADYERNARSELSELPSPYKSVQLAIVDEKTVGYMHVSRPELPQIEHRAMFEVGVLPSARGHGIGKVLVVEAEKWATQVGCNQIGFYVVADNVGAVALYVKLGYRFEGLRRRAFKLGGELLDEYIMAKPLIQSA